VKKRIKKIFTAIVQFLSLKISKTIKTPSISQTQTKPNKQKTKPKKPTTLSKLQEIKFVIFRSGKNCIPKSSKSQGE